MIAKKVRSRKKLLVLYRFNTIEGIQSLEVGLVTSSLKCAEDFVARRHDPNRPWQMSEITDGEEWPLP